MRTFRYMRRVTEVKHSPEVGDIVFWQYYDDDKGTERGHIGIVAEAGSNHMMSWEGNTNDEGHREGYEVALRERGYNWYCGDGLRLLGFIRPSELVESIKMSAG